MPDYRRIRVPGGTYFLTVAIADRQATLLIDHLQALRDAFTAVRKLRPFQLDAIVVLPDHLHCLWTLPPGDAAFPERWSQIKAAFSRRIPKGERGRPSRIAKRERGLWQRRYWEHWVRDETDFRRRLDYIHYNPIKHGYVTRAVDWPHSSFQRWLPEASIRPIGRTTPTQPLSPPLFVPGRRIRRIARVGLPDPFAKLDCWTDWSMRFAALTASCGSQTSDTKRA